MAPPTGLGPADCFGWDERLNWTHNESITEEGNARPQSSAQSQPQRQNAELAPASPQRERRRSSLFSKLKPTTSRTRRGDGSASGGSELPPFTFKEVPYDVWRKHYAKDAQGNYRGTHAPAEDCLLMPDDVAKWRLEAPKTKADLWTRGSEALPVYGEVRDDGFVPEYEGENAPEYEHALRGVEELSVQERGEAEAAQRDGSTASAVGSHVSHGSSTGDVYGEDSMMRPTHSYQAGHSVLGGGPEPYGEESMVRPSRSHEPNHQQPQTADFQQPHQQQKKIIANGMTAEEIITAEKEKNKSKPKGNMTWKQRVKKGAEFAMMGAN